MNTILKPLILICFVNYTTSSIAQETPPPKAEKPQKALPRPINKGFFTIGYNYGISPMFSDIGNETGISFTNRFKFAHQLALEKRLNKYLGFGIYGRTGKMAENQRDLIKVNNRWNQSVQYNFENTFTQFGAYAKAYFDWDGADVVAPFITAGVSYMTFDLTSDLLDANGNPYYYWGDGTIRDREDINPEVDPNQWTINLTESKILKRDYTYETKLTQSFDSSNTTFKKSSLVFPITLGFRLKLYEFLETRLSGTYNITQTDVLDNFKKGGNDSYLYTSVGVYFTFGERYIDPKERRYQGVDFISIATKDSDGDGISDINDQCPNTKKGIPVNPQGCPLDDDNDGVPNYLDKEPNSKPNESGHFVVDRYGRALTDKQIEDMEKQRQGLLMERTERFYEAPSLEKLKEFDIDPSKSESSGASVALPKNYHYADYNGNGIIESLEISRVIDDFFSGEIDVTVTDILELIDFFFEQY